MRRAWSRILAERLPGARIADLAGVDAPVTEPVAKRALYDATGAVAVDTESHIAAAIAAAYGVPFAVFRVVADDARRSLPPAASVGLSPDGRISGGAVLGSLARTPAQLPSLLRTAIDARTASCARGRRPCPGLANPDLGFAPRVVSTYCVGRWCSANLFAIAPPCARRNPTDSALGVAHRILHRGRFVTAMHHAIGALLVVSVPYVPVGFFHQLAKRTGVAFSEQITRTLPAENIAGLPQGW